MVQTLAYYAAVFQRDFVHYTTRRLQDLGLRFGSLFLILYVGKHPGCTQAELTAALKLDWGYSQRSITKLVDEGFFIREKLGRAYHLNLSDRGKAAFEISHQAFFDWDREALSALNEDEKVQLFSLLEKAVREKENKADVTLP